MGHSYFISSYVILIPEVLGSWWLAWGPRTGQTLPREDPQRLHLECLEGQWKCLGLTRWRPLETSWIRFRSLDFMVVGYCACLPRSIFGSQLGIILFHSYLQLIHRLWAEYGRMLFTAGLCKPWPVEHQRPIAISLPIQPCLTARLEHHEAKRMNPRRRLMLPDQKLQQKKNKPKVALANGRKRKLFLPPPTSKYIWIYACIYIYIYSVHETVEDSRRESLPELMVGYTGISVKFFTRLFCHELRHLSYAHGGKSQRSFPEAKQRRRCHMVWERMSFVFISIPSIARCLKRSVIYSCPCTFYHFLTFLLSLLILPFARSSTNWETKAATFQTGRNFSGPWWRGWGSGTTAWPSFAWSPACHFFGSGDAFRSIWSVWSYRCLQNYLNNLYYILFSFYCI